MSVNKGGSWLGSLQAKVVTGMSIQAGVAAGRCFAILPTHESSFTQSVVQCGRREGQLCSGDVFVQLFSGRRGCL